MNKDLTFVLSPNVKYILITLFLLHFISFTECFITTNGYSINGSYSLNPTSRYRNINQYQQCFSSNNTDLSIDTDVSNNNVITTTHPKIDDDISQDKILRDHSFIDRVRVFTYESFPYVHSDIIKHVYATICANDINISEIIKTEMKKLRCDGISNLWRFDVLNPNINTLIQNDAYKFLRPGIAVSYNSSISNTLKKKLSEKNITVIEGEKVDNILETASDELKRIALDKRIPKLYGKAEVNKVFKDYKNKNKARCVVTYGRINPFLHVRIMRGDRLLFYGELLSLKRETDYPIDIFEGESCMIIVDDFNDFKVGDVIEEFIE